MTRRRTLWAALTSALTLIVAGAWVIGSQVRSPREAAAKASPPKPSVLTAVVERRSLTATIIQRGDVRVGSSYAVDAPSSVNEPLVVTRAVLTPGEQVSEGALLVEVSGRPVFVLQGAVPAYRELSPGTTGADVKELQTALGRLGCDGGSDATFGEALKACVTAFYNKAGYQPLSAGVGADGVSKVDQASRVLADAEDGVISASEALTAGSKPDATAILAAKASLDGAQRAYESSVAQAASNDARAQAVLDSANATLQNLLNQTSTTAAPAGTPSDIDAAKLAVKLAQLSLDDTVRAGKDSIAAATGALQVARAQYVAAIAPRAVSILQQALASAQRARDSAKSALDDAERLAGPRVPLGEILFLPTMPSTVQSEMSLGDELSPAGAIPSNSSPVGQGNGQPNSSKATPAVVTLVSGGFHIALRVSVSAEPLLSIGTVADLLDEISGNVYKATLSGISSAPTVGSDGDLAYDAMLTPNEELPAEMSGRNVRVTFTTASSVGPVLVVPLAALWAGPDGVAHVEKVSSDGSHVTVTVNAGVSADGSVAVTPLTPNDLTEGDEVVIGAGPSNTAASPGA
jgi:peptidoglycan hydrolase-like protein with peptidoglycan-binding domain